jgi:hypothetical protein
MLLTPFIRRDIWLPTVAAFRLLFLLRPLVRLIVFGLSIVPKPIKIALLKLFTGNSSSSSVLVVSILLLCQ